MMILFIFCSFFLVTNRIGVTVFNTGKRNFKYKYIMLLVFKIEKNQWEDSINVRFYHLVQWICLSVATEEERICIGFGATVTRSTTGNCEAAIRK